MLCAHAPHVWCSGLSEWLVTFCGLPLFDAVTTNGVSAAAAFPTIFNTQFTVLEVNPEEHRICWGYHLVPPELQVNNYYQPKPESALVLLWAAW
jgi:hypothetical protein